MSGGSKVPVSASFAPTQPNDARILWEVPDSSKNMICLVDKNGNECSSITTGTDEDGGLASNHVQVKAIVTGTSVKKNAELYVTPLEKKSGSLKKVISIEVSDHADSVKISSGKTDVTWNEADADQVKKQKVVSLQVGKSTALRPSHTVTAKSLEIRKWFGVSLRIQILMWPL